MYHHLMIKDVKIGQIHISICTTAEMLETYTTEECEKLNAGKTITRTDRYGTVKIVSLNALGLAALAKA